MYGPNSVMSYGITNQINNMLLESLIKAHPEAKKLDHHKSDLCPVCKLEIEHESKFTAINCDSAIVHEAINCDSAIVHEAIHCNSPKSIYSEECKFDENEYKIAVLLDIIHKNKNKINAEDRHLFNKINPQSLLSTTKNDSVDSYKFKNLLI